MNILFYHKRFYFITIVFHQKEKARAAKTEPTREVVRPLKDWSKIAPQVSVTSKVNSSNAVFYEWNAWLPLTDCGASRRPVCRLE